MAKWIHLLESKWRYVLSAALIVVLFTWSMITFGIPGLAYYVAFKLPVSFDEKLSEGTLALLDERILEPSCLADDDQHRIEEKFDQIVERSNDAHNYQLLFRRGLGPNAFALPSGEIVITDELIELAENDEEILAVLTHEIGHVVYKHGLRNALQASAVALLITTITGDIGAASGLAATLPVVLLQTNYSRKFEHEADDYAFNYMRANHIDTKYFALILQKITGDIQQEAHEGNVFDYLSTHPMTTDRIQRFLEHSHSQ
jgi:Zn-dependent protease with chaperone function